MRIVLILTSLAICVSSTAIASGPHGLVQVGNWKGGAYTNDASGAFSHCAAGTPYQSGIYFMVSINAQGAWSLGFAHQSWQLRPGETIPIGLTFDNRSPVNVFGTALGSNLAVVPMPPNSELITQFRNAVTMAAFAKGNVFQFRLDTTSQLLPALANCVVQAKSGTTPNIRVQATQRQKPAPAISSLKPDQPPTGALPTQELQIVLHFERSAAKSENSQPLRNTCRVRLIRCRLEI
jgi:hypothetical protein